MTQMTFALVNSRMGMHGRSSGALLRTVSIGLTAFLTVVDLFATQAILPSLTRAYGVTPAEMAFAVNASTMGMAVAGLAVALFSRRIDRRQGILISLIVLAIPTALLATAPNLTVFTILRVAQGLCMASAFTLTLAYLGEECSAANAGGAFAAYITGNVASNLVGRLISAGVADHLGLASNFYFFAGLNLVGAVLVYLTIARTEPMAMDGAAGPSVLEAWRLHLRNPHLRAAFGIGFCILFAFIGTFTYVNFVLVRSPLALGPMALGFVYFRVSAFDRDDAAGRMGGGPLRHAAGALGRPGARRRRPAALAAAAARSRTARHGADRRRDVFRPGCRHRLRQPRRDRRSRRRERTVSGQLLRRRAGRHRRSRPGIRSHRVVRLRRRHWCRARRGRDLDVPPQRGRSLRCEQMSDDLGR